MAYKKTRVIIDTDPGIDDAMAILLALGSPNIFVEGLTIVHGNSIDVEKLGRNACVILKKAGLNEGDIPVHIGAYAPLIKEDNRGAEFVHGNNCLGEIAFEDPGFSPHPHHSGVQFIISKVLENPGEITLIALGPLTNIALALKLYPSLPKFVKGLVIMGGAVFVPGNTTSTAEANIHSDPEAAKLVFKYKWPNLITMVALDCTNHVMITPAQFEELRDMNEVGKFIFDIVGFLQSFTASVSLDGSKDCAMHDATAIMAVVNPNLFGKAAELCIDVETRGEITRAMTVPMVRSDDNPDFNPPPNVRLLLKPNVEEIFKQFKNAIASFSMIENF